MTGSRRFSSSPNTPCSLLLRALGATLIGALLAVLPLTAHAQVDSTTVTVKDAGSSTVNGSYTCLKDGFGNCDTFNGHAKFENDSTSSITIEWVNSQWEIRKTTSLPSVTTYYTSSADQFRPPESSSQWAVFSGTSPTPTLSYSTDSTSASAPTASTDPATSVSSDFATLNGSVNPQGDTTTVTFYFGRTGGSLSSVEAPDSPLTGDFEQSVSLNVGLSPDTEYRFYVEATNSAGSDQGTERVFTTPPGAPTATTTSASNITDTEAQLNGRVNPQGASTTVEFEYWPTGSPGSSQTVTATQSPVDGKSEKAVSATISSLSAETDYTYRVTASNSKGSDQGAETGFSTVALPTATTQSATNITSNQAQLNGSVDPGGDSTTVEFEYWPTGSPDSSQIVFNSDTLLTGTSVQSVDEGLFSLDPNTSYTFQILASNSAGSAQGGEQTFTTDVAPPEVGAEPVSNLEAGKTSVTLNGEVDPGGGTATVEFKYLAWDWRISNDPDYEPDTLTVTAAESPVSGNSIQEVSATISGLSIDQPYRFWITAENSAGAAEDGSPELGFDQRMFNTFSLDPGAFILQKQDTTGGTSSAVIDLKTRDSVTTYNFTVKWGSDSTQTVTGDDPDLSHTYPDKGTYTVKIDGTVPHLPIGHPGDGEILGEDDVDLSASNQDDRRTTVLQWGNIQWESMAYMFAGHTNVHFEAADNPDLANVRDMSSMFQRASWFNSDIGDWNVSNVTDMGDMFNHAENFNQDIGEWDVAGVTDMSSMFLDALAFNRDIGNWDVSSVTEMDFMFLGAESFNQDISEWDAGNVTDMTNMFIDANSFNQPIGAWDVSSVTKMGGMFGGADNFDQDLGAWDVSNVTDFGGGSTDFVESLSPANYDALLIGWSRLDLRDGIDLSAGNSSYTLAGADDKAEIDNEDFWFFTDDGTTEAASVSLTGGSGYQPPDPQPGTDDNPVGRLALDADQSGSVIDRAVLTSKGASEGVDTVSVWSASQPTFDAGTAQRLTAKNLDPSTEVPPTFTMTDLDRDLSSTDSTYLFVTYDLTANASTSAELLLADSTDATLYAGVVTNKASTFPLSLNASTTAPTTVSSKTVSGDTTATFDGTGAGLSFSGVSNSGGVTVSRYDEAPNDTGGINESNVSNYRLTIEADSTLDFTSSQLQIAVSEVPGITDPTGVTIYKRDTVGVGDFSALTTTVGDNGTDSDVTDDTLYASPSSFSEFAVASDSEPLPVEMASFGAQLDDGSVQLSWKTTSETNNAGFRIQRRPSDEEGAWMKVGSVEGAGTTSEAQSYQFTDGDLPYEADALTYRLKQVDTDGSASFTETVTVERGVSEVQLLGTYPNPARQQATVRYALPSGSESGTGSEQRVTVRLYDVLGRQVRTVVSDRKEGRHEQTLDVSSLSSGVYFLRLRSQGTIKTQKLTIVR